MGKGDTILNAVIGAVVTWVAGTVLSIIPFIGTLLGPVAGGATAGLLQESHDNSVSIKVGAISGVIAFVPAMIMLILVMVAFGGMGFASAMPIGFAGFGLGLILIIGLFAGVITVALSAVGGLVGQHLHERD